MKSLFTTFNSWRTTRKAMQWDRSALENHQAGLWASLQKHLKKTPALSEFAYRPLENFPILTPDQIRSNLLEWNSRGISDTPAYRAAEKAETGQSANVIPDVIAGYSTGTSGTRGLFLANKKERAIYLGQSLAKLLPLDTLYQGARVMLFLRSNSQLYSNGKRAGPFKFQYCPLSLSKAEKIAALQDFKPTILIAPSHVLNELAEIAAPLSSLLKCYYGAEPMGAAERIWIGEKIGVRPDPIYQATEGFLAASCPYGRLHLNEDSFYFEFEPVNGTNGYQIIVTDLYRHTQPIVRVRLDDYIEIDPRQCKCGFTGRTILPVSGRVQNLWQYGNKIITPRPITNCLESILGPQNAWEVKACPTQIELYLNDNIPSAVSHNAVRNLRDTINIDCPIEIKRLNNAATYTKRHRIKWSDYSD